MSDALLSSKTMKLVLLTMVVIVGVFVFAAILEAVFNVRVPYVAEALAAITGNSGIGAARNAYVDGPMRQQQNQAGYNPPPPPA